MSSLESLKKELMKKPDVVDRKPVFVIVTEFVDESGESLERSSMGRSSMGRSSFDREELVEGLIDRKLIKVTIKPTKKTADADAKPKADAKAKPKADAKAKGIKQLTKKLIIEESSEEEEDEERRPARQRDRVTPKVKKLSSAPNLSSQ